MKQLLEIFDKNGRVLHRSFSPVYVPGLVFILLGVSAILAPKFLIALLATFFIFIGALCVFLGWKFLALKKQVEEVAERFGGKVFLHGVSLRDPLEEAEFFFEDEEESDSDDDGVTFH